MDIVPLTVLREKRGVSRSVSVVVLRRSGGEIPTKIHPTESAVVCHWTYHFSCEPTAMYINLFRKTEGTIGLKEIG